MIDSTYPPPQGWIFDTGVQWTAEILKQLLARITTCTLGVNTATNGRLHEQQAPPRATRAQLSGSTKLVVDMVCGKADLKISKLFNIAVRADRSSVLAKVRISSQYYMMCGP
jgi:hypothetical protein